MRVLERSELSSVSGGDGSPPPTCTTSEGQTTCTCPAGSSLETTTINYTDGTSATILECVVDGDNVA